MDDEKAPAKKKRVKTAAIVAVAAIAGALANNDDVGTSLATLLAAIFG